MKSMADGLPAEIASQIHPDWRKNEAEYWRNRPELLEQYRDQWIGFADGAVIASGRSAVQVLHAAQQTGRHPFVICVGREDEPTRIRRSSFPYDMTYSPEPLPLVTVEIRLNQGQPGVALDHVIADTGADSTILPWADCQLLQLAATQGAPSFIAGVGGGLASSIMFSVWAWLDGQDCPCRLQADFVGNERILGRDVLNRVDVLFRGPSGEVVINP